MKTALDVIAICEKMWDMPDSDKDLIEDIIDNPKKYDGKKIKLLMYKDDYPSEDININIIIHLGVPCIVEFSYNSDWYELTNYLYGFGADTLDPFYKNQSHFKITANKSTHITKAEFKIKN